MKPVVQLAVFLLLSFAVPGSIVAQAPRVYTAADYAQAEKFMPYNVNPLVLHMVDNPQWTPDNRFWYRDRAAAGTNYVMVDPAKKTRTPAFDQAKMAHALQPLAPQGTTLTAGNLPIQNFATAEGGNPIMVIAYGRRILCDLSADGKCDAMDQPPPPGQRRRRRTSSGDLDYAPDGSKAVFIRDWNLWLRDLASGNETQLTTDGQPNYGYATDNAGWTHSDNPIVVWSADSKHIATFQQDQRKTGELYLTDVVVGHPTLTTLKYPLPGDPDITMIERVIIDLPATADGKANVIRLKMPPDQHRSTLCDDVSCRGGSGWDDVEWSADAKTLAFVSTSRDHKQEWMRIADAHTGEVRDIMGETVKTYFESGNDKVNWHYLSASNQLLWFSERDNWGHLYLYDIATGKLVNQVTSGNWNVTQVLNVDEKEKVIYFRGVGKEAGVDPYYQMYYRVNFDGSHLILLTDNPEPADHEITPSPDNTYFIDSFSTPTRPQITVVRDRMGKIVVDVAREDITKLKAIGWQPPVQIMVKARDGITDIYGLLFRPSDFSTDKKYPIINHIYPGPQTGSCGSRQFGAAHGDLQSVAELGFIVVCIDGTGTPFRSKSFHDAYFGDLGDNTLPDQVAGMKQLGDRYPWIDLKRVGIYGHSGGGYAAAGAMFHFPEFFKVGISESGNHDNRDYEDDWAEKWIGLEVKNADGTSNYDTQANENYAKNLTGHLLLAHGTMDDNVPPVNTLLVVDELIKANKTFDLLMIPNAHHGYAAAAQYMTRRRWDYFVTWLAGATPPNNYQMEPQSEAQQAQDGGGPSDLDWTNDPSN